MNGWYQDQDPNWLEVWETTVDLSTDSRIVEPRVSQYWEKSRMAWSNVKKVKLSMALSLVSTDLGMLGVVGGHDTRSPVFKGPSVVKDCYDEYIVDREWEGAWSGGFPRDTLEVSAVVEGDTISWPAFAQDEEHLFDSVHYLGDPLDTAKVYWGHEVEVGDIVVGGVRWDGLVQ